MISSRKKCEKSLQNSSIFVIFENEQFQTKNLENAPYKV